MNLLYNFNTKDLYLKKPFPLLFWFPVIFTMIVAGTLGFMIIEDFNFLDALYMTIITVTTIGYKEVRPLSDAGKVFDIILIVISFSTFTYALARLTQYIASGELGAYFKNRRLMQAIAQLNN